MTIYVETDSVESYDEIMKIIGPGRGQDFLIYVGYISPYQIEKLSHAGYFISRYKRRDDAIADYGEINKQSIAFIINQNVKQITIKRISLRLDDNARRDSLSGEITYDGRLLLDDATLHSGKTGVFTGLQELHEELRYLSSFWRVPLTTYCEDIFIKCLGSNLLKF